MAMAGRQREATDERRPAREARLAPAQGADDRRRRQDPRARSSTTSRSPRSATSRTRSCWRRGARPGGYRLYSQADVERLRTILRMQRDEFLPLRVIRQELADRRLHRAGGRASAARSAAAMSVDEPGDLRSPQEELLEQAGAQRELPARAAGLRDRRSPSAATGAPVYDETDLEIVRAAAELSRFGVAGRNLRVFRTSADREAALLEQLLGRLASLAQPGAAQGGGREPREPRRGLRPPQAPAAGPRPAPPQAAAE